jgi:hypothetical protein
LEIGGTAGLETGATLKQICARLGMNPDRNEMIWMVIGCGSRLI